MMTFIYILIGIGFFFAFAGVLGMLRMPDVYCRMQSSTNIATMGMLGVVIGGILFSAVYLKDANMAVKLGVLGLFYLLTNPIGSQALAKGAYFHGVKPSEQTICDQLGEDLEDAED